MIEGDRKAQKIAGAWVLAIGSAVLLVPLLTLKQMPSGLYAWIGAGALVAGLWLVVPVGMGGLFRQARESWHEFRGHDSGEE